MTNDGSARLDPGSANNPYDGLRGTAEDVALRLAWDEGYAAGLSSAAKPCEHGHPLRAACGVCANPYYPFPNKERAA